ncbi:hydroxymethylglutaryl-CoA lyase [Zhihengliuella flava]|uniref:hydroxymethylglutaryl-CoA lyase n=1 Tax=Zhihengliuella flava TaxID=1285193 RepID=UPI002F2B7A44
MTDVFLRDGLQDEDVIVSVADRVHTGELLAAAGVGRFEVGSLVNPQRVPQMRGTEEVLARLQQTTASELTVLALNARGVRRAAEAGATDVQIVASASQAHSAANAGRSTEVAMEELAAEVARHPELRFHAGISTAFTCPIEGPIEPERVIGLVRGFLTMGVHSIGLADTVGTTNPAQIGASLEAVQAAEPDVTYSLHLHNAHGQALRSVDVAIAAGVTRFDAALAGFGGCPFAPGAAGNLATEALVRHLHASGHQTGINEELLAEAADQARAIVRMSPPHATHAS